MPWWVETSWHTEEGQRSMGLQIRCNFECSCEHRLSSLSTKWKSLFFFFLRELCRIWKVLISQEVINTVMRCGFIPGRKQPCGSEGLKCCVWLHFFVLILVSCRREEIQWALFIYHCLLTWRCTPGLCHLCCLQVLLISLCVWVQRSRLWRDVFSSGPVLVSIHPYFGLLYQVIISTLNVYSYLIRMWPGKMHKYMHP